jgi:hypothetical protein
MDLVLRDLRPLPLCNLHFRNTSQQSLRQQERIETQELTGIGTVKPRYLHVSHPRTMSGSHMLTGLDTSLRTQSNGVSRNILCFRLPNHWCSVAEQPENGGKNLRFAVTFLPGTCTLTSLLSLGRCEVDRTWLMMVFCPYTFSRFSTATYSPCDSLKMFFFLSISLSAPFGCHSPMSPDAEHVPHATRHMFDDLDLLNLSELDGLCLILHLSDIQYLKREISLILHLSDIQYLKREISLKARFHMVN